MWLSGNGVAAHGQCKYIHSICLYVWLNGFLLETQKVENRR